MYVKIKGFLNLILFAGKSKEDYKKVHEDMMESNISILRVLSGISTIFYFVCFCLGQFVANMHTKLFSYAIGLIPSLLIFLITLIIKNNLVISICMYLFDAFLLISALVLTLINAPEQLTITLIPFVLILPIFYDDKPYKVTILIIISDLIYFFTAIKVKPDDILVLDITDVFVFSIIGLMFGFYTAKTKIERYMYAYELKKISIMDELTGCFNRRAFEQDIDIINQNNIKTNTCSMMIDVNGLKDVNDTLGHKAGDELISAVAITLRDIFNVSGKCYRIGGDEFVVIMNLEKEQVEMLIEKTNRALASYTGKYVRNVTVSIGYVISRDYPDYNIENLVKEADKKMYDSKIRYYKTIGREKRIFNSLSFCK